MTHWGNTQDPCAHLEEQKANALMCKTARLPKSQQSDPALLADAFSVSHEILLDIENDSLCLEGLQQTLPFHF